MPGFVCSCLQDKGRDRMLAKEDQFAVYAHTVCAILIANAYVLIQSCGRDARHSKKKERKESTFGTIST